MARDEILQDHRLYAADQDLEQHLDRIDTVLAAIRARRANPKILDGTVSAGYAFTSEQLDSIRHYAFAAAQIADRLKAATR